MVGHSTNIQFFYLNKQKKSAAFLHIGKKKLLTNILVDAFHKEGRRAQ